MSSKPSTGKNSDAAILTRRLLFFVLLFGLVFFYLVLSFKGLTTSRGMEQAQIGREIARGNDFTTKVIRPAAIWQAEKTGSGTIELDRMHDTYHSPLNPFLYGAVLKMVGATDFEKFQMKTDGMTVYQLDRVIAAVSMICFLVAIGINYLLISRIFDTKIAGVTALLMALCDLMWSFTQTGLPQMLMLVLFSSALFFIYRALEASLENRVSIGAILVAAVFLSLLALTHWLTIWITLGFVIYAAFFFRPKGVAGLSVIGILILFSLYFMMKNVEWTGSPAGTAGLTLYGGLSDSEEGIMRTVDPSAETYTILYNLNSLILSTTRNILLQANQLYTNLGGIIAAPLFFFALLHPFKRKVIAHFRWIILMMWIFAALGMAIFGLSQKSTDTNQLHMLFIPMMTAYGLAFLTILWSRLEIPSGMGIARNGHFILAILISAGPLLLTIPNSFRSGLFADGKQRPVWPPYWPLVLNRTLHNATAEQDLIMTDQPWAVAWYGDRHAVWLPKRVEEFEKIEKMAEDQKLGVAGIVVSPSSFADNPLYRPGAFGTNDDFAAMYLDGPASLAQGNVGLGSLVGRTQKLSEIASRYSNPVPLFPGRVIFYSAKPILGR